MNYLLASAKPNGLPYDKKTDPFDPNSPTVYGVKVIIKTKIENQTYDGFENTDFGFCDLLRTDTIDVCLVKINTYALKFVATKYPST